MTFWTFVHFCSQFSAKQPRLFFTSQIKSVCFYLIILSMEHRIIDIYSILKFIYFEKVTKFCEISTLLLSVCTVDKSKVEISQYFVAFSEYTNFTNSFESLGDFRPHYSANSHHICSSDYHFRRPLFPAWGRKQCYTKISLFPFCQGL